MNRLQLSLYIQLYSSTLTAIIKETSLGLRDPNRNSSSEQRHSSSIATSLKTWQSIISHRHLFICKKRQMQMSRDRRTRFMARKSSPSSTAFAAVPARVLPSSSGILTATRPRPDDADDGRPTSVLGDVISGLPYCFRSTAADTFTSEWNWRDVVRPWLGLAR